MGDDDDPDELMEIHREFIETLTQDGWCPDRVLVRTKMQNRALMVAWCEEHIGPVFEGRRSDTNLDFARSFQARYQFLASFAMPNQRVLHAFGFRHEPDAVLFRLHWSEYVVPVDRIRDALRTAR